MSDKLTTEKAEAAARSAGAVEVLTVEFDASSTIGVAITVPSGGFSTRNYAERFGQDKAPEDVFDWVSSVFERVFA
jgi:hypothetical protein